MAAIAPGADSKDETGIVSPGGGDKDYSIVAFGAVGDGTTINTVSIQRAIDRCAQDGGGIVRVPEGNFLTGTITLRSGVTLHLEKDGEILGSPHKSDYPDRFTDNPFYRRGPRNSLVFASRQDLVSITGEGTINGNARMDSTGDFRDLGNNTHRPTLIWFDQCTNVLFRDFTCRQSLMWTCVCVGCRQLHINHIIVTENYFYNSDGIDVIDCEDFLVEHCDINCDDDGICLKSQFENGCRRGVVRNNRVRSLCNAIKMGTGSSGGFTGHPYRK